MSEHRFEHKIDATIDAIEKVVDQAIADGAPYPAREVEQAMVENFTEQTPYPWCHGNPTKQDCINAGYCRRDPNCGE